MQVAAVIQARTGSTRLPGKVLLEVAGQPLLGHMVKQLLACRKLASLSLATSNLNQDDILAECGHKLGLKVHRGSENDVLDRYHQAALELGAAHVMRLTADCPLIQPDLCDRLIDEYATGDYDYIRTSERFAEGLDCEIISFAALDRSWWQARLSSQREHVTLYARDNPQEFRLKEIENHTDDSRYRLTVDEPEDFALVRAVIETLGGNGDWIKIERIKAFLDARPDILVLNSHVVRNQGLIKSLEAEKNLNTGEQAKCYR